MGNLSGLRRLGVGHADVDARIDRLEAAGWRFESEFHDVMEQMIGHERLVPVRHVRARLYDPDGEFVVDVPLYIQNNSFMRLLDEYGVPQ